MSDFQVDIYCYDVNKKLLAKIDAGKMSQEAIIEHDFHNSRVCKPEVMRAVKEEKGSEVSCKIKQIMISYTNIIEVENTDEPSFT